MKPLVRPLAYEVMHRDADGRRKSVRVFSHTAADRIFDEQEKAGLDPTLYLGGMELRGVGGGKLSGARRVSAGAGASPDPAPRRRRKCRCHENPPTGKCLHCIEELVAA